MASQHDPHANHTPEQIGELQDAYGHIDDAIRHLRGELLDPFDDPDIDEAIRHLREARMWLSEVLLNAGHEPEVDQADGESSETETPAPTPIH
jgi:hypothetical protein